MFNININIDIVYVIGNFILKAVISWVNFYEPYAW